MMYLSYSCNISPTIDMHPSHSDNPCMKASMLLLIAMVLSASVPGVAPITVSHASTLDSNSSLSIRSGTHRAHNSGTRLQARNETTPVLVKNQTGKDVPKGASSQNLPIDLIFFDSRLSQNGRSLTGSKAKEDWITRHSYNVASPTSVVNTTGTITKSTNGQGNDTSQTETTTGSKTPSGDPMEVSDSRIAPQRLHSRSDHEESTNEHGGDTGDPYGEDNFDDAASSNLIEKKVVRELTKILSKGMSGATDQIRLETLENLQRRTRERKAVKDSRAKAFEEILNTAINSHPEKTKKVSTSRSKSNGGQASSIGSTGLAGTGLENSDPELSADAETVLQHLQSLSGTLDAQSPGFMTGQSGADSVGSDDPSSGSFDGSDSSFYDSNESSNDSPAADDKQRSKKVAVESNERPLVRQFKKLKNQISQRRKQLDQIKKLFNVELSINPKDGSLVGKPSGAGKKKSSSTDESSAETDNEHLSNKRSKTHGKGTDKVQELMSYLRDNPGILASVMAELTVDADPSSKISLPLSSREEGPYQTPGSLSEIGDTNMASLSNRKTVSSLRNNIRHQNHESSAMDHDDYEPSWFTQRARRQSGRAGVQEANYGSGDELQHSLRARRIRASAQPSTISLNGGASMVSAVKSAEALLLESLRERQLLNLARLDMVLAERASQASSNRSSVFSTTPTIRAPLGRSYQPQMMANGAHYDDAYGRVTNDRQARYNEPTDGLSRNVYQRSDEEVSHHFAVVNPMNRSTIEIPLLGYRNYQTQTSRMASPSQYNDAQMMEQQAKVHDATDLRYQNAYKAQHHQVAPQQTLRRFKDWRDVSQSEASSWQSDKMPMQNVSWLPYDLNTGGSAAALNQFNGSPSMIHYNSVPSQGSLRTHMGAPTSNLPQQIQMTHTGQSPGNSSTTMDGHYGSQQHAAGQAQQISAEQGPVSGYHGPPPTQQHQQPMSDSVVTRPGPSPDHSSSFSVAPPYQQTPGEQRNLYPSEQVNINNPHQRGAKHNMEHSSAPVMASGPDNSMMKMNANDFEQNYNGIRGKNASTRERVLAGHDGRENSVNLRPNQRTNEPSNGQRQDTGVEVVPAAMTKHRNRLTSDFDEYETNSALNSDYFGSYKQQQQQQADNQNRPRKKARSVDYRAIDERSKTHYQDMFDDEDGDHDNGDSHKGNQPPDSMPNDDDMGAIW